MMRILLVLLVAGCAAGLPRSGVERSATESYPKDIAIVRAAAMSSLVRMGLTVTSLDSTGEEQRFYARSEDALVRVALERSGADATVMRVHMHAEEESNALERFFDGVDAVIAAPPAQGSSGDS